MNFRERVAFLTDWALRDLRQARGQTRIDMKTYPGIEHAVARQLELREEFGKPGSDWPAILEEIIPTETEKGKKK